MKKSKIVWFDETETRIPELQMFEDDLDYEDCNGDEIVIKCSLKKPKQNAKKLKITIEEI